MALAWCDRCCGRRNSEVAELSKGESLSFFAAHEMDGLLKCEACGQCYEEWQEEGVDGVCAYRNRLTVIEVLYTLQNAKQPESRRFYNSLLENLDAVMLELASEEMAQNTQRLEWIQMNLIHFYHAKGDRTAIDNMIGNVSSGISMAVQCHLMDPPLLKL